MLRVLPGLHERRDGDALWETRGIASRGPYDWAGQLKGELKISFRMEINSLETIEHDGARISASTSGIQALLETPPHHTGRFLVS